MWICHYSTRWRRGPRSLLVPIDEEIDENDMGEDPRGARTERCGLVWFVGAHVCGRLALCSGVSGSVGLRSRSLFASIYASKGGSCIL